MNRVRIHSKNIDRGKIGEDAVTALLQKESFTIVERNFRTAFGEVDIVAQKRDVLAFIEVKLRVSNRIDSAEIILPSKQKKIVMVAQHFLSKHAYHEMIIRFDVALVHYVNNQCSIQYIPNAFTSCD